MTRKHGALVERWAARFAQRDAASWGEGLCVARAPTQVSRTRRRWARATSWDHLNCLSSRECALCACPYMLRPTSHRTYGHGHLLLRSQCSDVRSLCVQYARHVQRRHVQQRRVQATHVACAARRERRTLREDHVRRPRGPVAWQGRGVRGFSRTPLRVGERVPRANGGCVVHPR